MTKQFTDIKVKFFHKGPGEEKIYKILLVIWSLVAGNIFQLSFFGRKTLSDGATHIFSPTLTN